MVKDKEYQAARQRHARRKKKQEFDKLKAFYAYILTQDQDIFHTFEARQLDDRKDDEMTYINYFALTLLE